MLANKKEKPAIALATNSKTIIPENIRSQHYEDWKKSGISDLTIDNMAKTLYLESNKDHWKLYYPALLENTKTDYYTIRLDNPPVDENGKVQGKYRRPEGQTSRIYRPVALEPAILKDTKQHLIITEGEKKAIKASEEGFNCIALAGVYCYFDPKNYEDRLIPDMHNIEWAGRKVYLIFDNDLWVKEQVQKALFKLAAILISKFGARVHLVYLPSCEKAGRKIGLDDYLKDYGKEALQKLIDETQAISIKDTRQPIANDEKITFPIEILSNELREFVTTASRVLDAPPEFIAGALISGAAILINSKGKIIIKKDWIEPCILWTMIVAKPGVQKKSPCLKLIKRIIDNLDDTLLKEYEAKKQEYEAKKIVYEKEYKDWKNKDVTTSPPEKPEEPHRELIYSSDATTESLIEFQKRNSHGLAIINDEGSSILRTYS